jgi:putative two-component system response regulator
MTDSSAAPSPGADVLVVDDQAPVRDVLSRMLTAAGHRCRTAGSVAEGRAAVLEREPDLLLCDIDMPGESGLVLARECGLAWPDVAVLMVTAIDDLSVADSAFESGAFGYVVKPFERNELLIAVASALRRRDAERHQRVHRQGLEMAVQERGAELRASLDALRRTSAALDDSHAELIRRLAIAAELRDPETASHLERMSRYSALLTGAAGLGPAEAELLRLASPMHDVGKIGIPDEILMKQGIFTAEDRSIMERHAVIGHQLLAGSDSALLELAASVALNHHERVDGTGYPNRRTGDQIPIEGRIVAIADVFDALTSERRYKRAMSLVEARDLMVASRGTHFDHDLLGLFVDRLDESTPSARAGWSRPSPPRRRPDRPSCGWGRSPAGAGPAGYQEHLHDVVGDVVGGGLEVAVEPLEDDHLHGADEGQGAHRHEVVREVGTDVGPGGGGEQLGEPADRG